MEGKSEIAVDLFANKGFLCSQAVLESHSAEYGLDTIITRKISTAFGGGMGHCDEVCGAVSGALMLIGLKYGQFNEGDNDSRKNTYIHTKDFIQIKARESGIFKTLCPKLVKRAVELIEEINEK
jgi:C_GCAxxG_C_C family probable redox protein